MDAEVLFRDDAGPIEEMTWGRYVIRGEEHAGSGGERIGAGKDIRVIGTEVTRWKDREGHRLKKSMITGVYDKELDALVLGVGVEGLVEVPDTVKQDVADHGIREIVIERTPAACRAYNQLHRAGKRVALLAHGTC